MQMWVAWASDQQGECKGHSTDVSATEARWKTSNARSACSPIALIVICGGRTSFARAGQPRLRAHGALHNIGLVGTELAVRK